MLFLALGVAFLCLPLKNSCVLNIRRRWSTLSQKNGVMLFEVDTIESFDTNVRGYKRHMKLTLEQTRRLIDHLLEELTTGRTKCFNVLPFEDDEEL